MKRVNLLPALTVMLLALQSPQLRAGEGTIELPDLCCRLHAMIDAKMEASLRSRMDRESASRRITAGDSARIADARPEEQGDSCNCIPGLRRPLSQLPAL